MHQIIFEVLRKVIGVFFEFDRPRFHETLEILEILFEQFVNDPQSPFSIPLPISRPG
jgi:hypothetical protein